MALTGGRPTGGVPLWELEFHAWEAATGRRLTLGPDCARLSPAEQERALQANAEIMLKACAEFGYAALTIPNAFWEQAPGELAFYILPPEARQRQCAILRALAPPELVLAVITGGVIGAEYTPEFCEALFDDPESIDARAEATLRSGLEVATRYRDLGAELLVTASDIADNSGPFFNPAQMDRFILPYTDRWAQGVHALDGLAVMHTDGNVTRYLPALAGTALDAIQAVDPVAGMDLAEAQRTVAGHLGLCGNVDCGLLLTGTPDDVYASVRDTLLAVRDGGGVVLGASNAVTPTVPIDNYRAAVAAWRTFCA
jgi:uroporphyrinogen decarboxylase